MLQNLCNRIYNGPSKKSVMDILRPKPIDYDEYNNEIPDYSLDYYGYMNQKSANSVLSRKRRGIIEECCYSPCSRENLLLYCGK
ncbi:unnamed protein product [Ceutorhynchus assimilis]|uniref:Insulin-like domain-containing protein n=1 Tax=Ceutorhynchus assimilis TaxID=467358 RepID=A0A9P0GMG0_9CUCU|nr:unnamed protein product [Ceutorhynchus assimilis]